MKYYINGSLFVKKGPSRVGEELAEEFRSLPFEICREEDIVDADDLTYDGLSSIFQLVILDNHYFLRERNCIGGFETEEITVEELEDEYIEFSEFLSHCTYVGRSGYMRFPAENGDESYCYENKNRIVLYEHPTRKIILNIDKNGNYKDTTTRREYNNISMLMNFIMEIGYLKEKILICLRIEQIFTN